MKNLRHLAIAAMAATALLATAAGKQEVVLTRQVAVDDKTFVLPDKTIELDIKRLEPVTKGGTQPLVAALQQLLESIEADEAYYRTVLVTFTNHGSDFEINIDGFDPLSQPLPAKADEAYFGDWQVGRLHALFPVTAEYKRMLELMFKRRGGKVTLVREFARVPYVIPAPTTHVNAMFSLYELTVNERIIDQDAAIDPASGLDSNIDPAAGQVSPSELIEE